MRLILHIKFWLSEFTANALQRLDHGLPTWIFEIKFISH